jgi:hypothetical protein
VQPCFMSDAISRAQAFAESPLVLVFIRQPKSQTTQVDQQ